MRHSTPSSRPPEPADHRTREQRSLALAVVVFFLGVGSVAIGFTYGPLAMGMAFLCLGSFSLLFALVWGILTLMERISN